MRNALVLFPSLVLFLTFCGGGKGNSSSAKGNESEFREVTVNQAADAIQGRQGKVRVVLLYGAFCPASRKMCFLNSWLRRKPGAKRTFKYSPFRSIVTTVCGGHILVHLQNHSRG